MSKQVNSDHENIYRAIMEQDEFFKKFLPDIPAIFNIQNPKCLEFLVECFTYLNSYFSYLSYSDVNTLVEIKEASLILGMHNSLNECNFDHEFWMRLFNHFEVKRNPCKCEKENVYNPMLSSPSEFENYLNYKFPKPKNNDIATKLNVDEEVKGWLENLNDDNLEIMKAEQPKVLERIPVKVDISVDHLEKNVNYILKKYSGLKAKESKETDYAESIKEFYHCMSNICEFIESNNQTKKVIDYCNEIPDNDMEISTKQVINNLSHSVKLGQSLELLRKENKKKHVN